MRAAWHRAAATAGRDEAVALELDAVADDARRRGALASAVAAHERAAQLSGDPGRTAGRLLRAAESAVELGRLDVVARLLDEVESPALGPLDRAGSRGCAR